MRQLASSTGSVRSGLTNVKGGIPVFVMNPYYTGLGIARSLAGSGVNVYGLTAERGAPGRLSRFFHGTYTIPNSRDEPEALCQRLLSLKEDHQDRPVLFPTRDFDVLFLHEYRGVLSPFYRLAQAAGPAVPNLLDKLQTARIAEEANVPAPRTALCTSSADIEHHMRLLRFPVVVKPRFAHQWRREGIWEQLGARKAILAQTPEQLIEECDHVMSLAGGALLQEFIPGEDDALVTFGCYMGSGGAVLGYFTGRKVLQSPPQFGTGCLVELVDIPEIVAPSVRLLRTAGYEGPAEVEYKLDRRSGQFWLIEANPRLWDQHELGRLAGVNLSAIAYQCATGLTPHSQPPNYTGVTHGRWIAEYDLTMLLFRTTWRHLRVAWRTRPAPVGGRIRESYTILRRALARAGEMLTGPRVFSVSALADPLPAVLMWIELAAEIRRAAARLTSRTREISRATGSPRS
jgi:predicted ATP-grasp superfamily ATP-dependent carboligase